MACTSGMHVLKACVVEAETLTRRAKHWRDGIVRYHDRGRAISEAAVKQASPGYRQRGGGC